MKCGCKGESRQRPQGHKAPTYHGVCVCVCVCSAYAFLCLPACLPAELLDPASVSFWVALHLADFAFYHVSGAFNGIKCSQSPFLSVCMRASEYVCMSLCLFLYLYVCVYVCVCVQPSSADAAAKVRR